MYLCIDVGKGTEDIQLIDPQEDVIENSMQLVLPSHPQSLKRQMELDKNNRFIISGELMAGEPYNKILYAKAEESPESVIMSETAARSLRYNLDQVRSRGIKIVSDDEISNYSGSQYNLRDIIWKRIDNVLEYSNIKLESITKVLLCCQDHGEPEDPDRSTRDFRMKSVYSPLDQRGDLSDLLINLKEIPSNMPRHRSIGESALSHFEHLHKDDIFVMDSSPAVINSIVDPSREHQLSINLGNGHTLAVYTEYGEVQAIYETHTGGVQPIEFENELHKMMRGELDHQTVLDSGGHGLYQRKPLDLSDHQITELKPYSVIGPNRRILDNLSIKYKYPAGNMMMAGPMGLYNAFKSRF